MFSSITNDKLMLPTATKFHYQFNLRDFARIIQTFLLTTPAAYKNNQLSLARLWLHECHRVWADRFIRSDDYDRYMGYVGVGLREFNALRPEDVIAEPLVFTSFVSACKGHDATLMQIASYEDLQRVLEDKLAEFNEQVSSMDLVLFTQAMQHITRIARIIDQPKGHALLVGVGGSGKQSLSQLSRFILSYDVFRIVVTSSFGLDALKAE